MYDLLLTNAVVITMDEKRRVIENGAVGVKDGRIAFVGDSMEAEQFEAKEVLDCKDHVVMPGFVDAHGHGGHSAFKSIVDLTSYWMPVMTHTYKNYITDDFWYNEGRLSALERLHAGVTTGVCVLAPSRAVTPLFPPLTTPGHTQRWGLRILSAQDPAMCRGLTDSAAIRRTERGICPRLAMRLC